MARILLTNNHLTHMGGTETWVLTMARHLAKEHEVGVYTRAKGYVSHLLKDFLDDNPTGYDLALINHNTCADVDAKFKIFTSHGTVPELEKPPESFRYYQIDYYVAVSENVSRHYGIPHIIKNPIDTERFKPTSEVGSQPNRILGITNSKIKGLNYLPVRRDVDDMPERINKADIVVSMGRGALEAMSCARPVIVWDNRPYWGERGDGYLDDFSKLTGNVAGEYKQKEIDWAEELAKYKPEHGQLNREYILKHHDVNKIAEEYLNIWKTATKKNT